MPADERKKGEDAALATVIGFESEYYILERGLQGERPDDTGKRPQDKHLVYGAVIEAQYGLHYVEGRGANVAVNDAEGNEQAGAGNAVEMAVAAAG